MKKIFRFSSTPVFSYFSVINGLLNVLKVTPFKKGPCPVYFTGKLST